MPKLTLDVNAIKALASETRLNVLRVLDGKKMSLKDISAVTKLHEVTVHEHLSKLVEAGLVNKKEREGHKWVYYKLSWKGECLLHPENTRVVVLFSTTFVTLFIGIIGLVHVAQNIMAPLTNGVGDGRSPYKGPLPDKGGSEILVFGQDPLVLYLTIGCLIFFIILMFISIRRWKKNKIQRL